jgi:prepilin-type N-terminal cleavage/methylation domain-containing protein
MCSNRKINRHDGFSMIELMISMAIMTIVTGAAFALIGSSIKFSSATYNITDTEEGVRAAHEAINRDLTTAGDGLKGIGTIQVPKAFVQTYLTQTPVVDSSNPNYVNLALVTSDDNVPGTTAVPQASPAANVLSGTDRLTLLTQDYTTFPQPVTVLAGKITQSSPNTNIVVASTDIGKFQAGEVYALEAQNSAAFFVISSVNSSTNTLTVTNGDVYSLNQTGAGTPVNVVSSGGTAPSTIVRIQMIHYFVNSNNLLIRRVFGVKGATFVDNVIAEHVTNLQFRYLVNLTDANGFVPQPVRQLSTSQQQLAVREVETTVAIETARAVNVVTANNTGKQVISSTTATTVRNLQFRQAL